MFRTSSFLRFLILFILLYGTLRVVWVMAENPYNYLLRVSSEHFFRPFLPEHILFFDAIEHQQNGMNIKIALFNKKMVIAAKKENRSPGFMDVSIRSWHVGYLPTTLLISLILSTPLPLIRRLWALGWGLLFVHIFITLKLTATILKLYEVSQLQWFNIAAFDPWFAWALNFIHETLYWNSGTTYIVPVFIWIFVLFRKSDLPIWVKPATTSPK